MTDDRTPHLNLPLPSPDNELEDDVLRLRSALGAIDAKIEALDELLASDDTTLDQLQELVTAIKDNRDTISDLLSDKVDTSTFDALEERVEGIEEALGGIGGETQEVEETHVLEEDQTVINLTVLTSTSGASVYVEGIRLKASDWTPDEEVATRLTLNKTYPAGHEVTVVRRQ